MEIRSPNTVIANALTDPIDLLKPRIALRQPKRIEFAVGTQINGIPHIGTYLVIAGAFTVAAKAAEVFNLPVSVKFGALENSPYNLVTSEDGRVYQRNFAHALPQSELDERNEILSNWSLSARRAWVVRRPRELGHSKFCYPSA